MTVAIPLNVLMFIFIGVAALLGGVLCKCIDDDVAQIAILVLVAIITLMCTGAYLCS